LRLQGTGGGWKVVAGSRWRILALGGAKANRNLAEARVPPVKVAQMLEPVAREVDVDVGCKAGRTVGLWPSKGRTGTAGDWLDNGIRVGTD
jgi:hypothetical protein